MTALQSHMRQNAMIVIRPYTLGVDHTLNDMTEPLDGYLKIVPSDKPRFEIIVFEEDSGADAFSLSICLKSVISSEVESLMDCVTYAHNRVGPINDDYRESRDRLKASLANLREIVGQALADIDRQSIKLRGVSE